MLYPRINPAQRVLFILLVLSAIALVGCAQAEADQVPPPAGTLDPAVEVTPKAMAEPTPTPTLFPTPTPAPPRLNPDALLPQINSAMAQVRGFQADGNWSGDWFGGEYGPFGAEGVATQFVAEVDLLGNSRLLFTRYTNGSAIAEHTSLEMRQVNGITFVQEDADGRWSVRDTGLVSVLELATIQAALSGTLALEDMNLEQVVSADWRQVYRITGRVPSDPTVGQVVILVDPEEMRILELRLEASGSAGERGKPRQQGDYVEVRFSDFDEPVEIAAPLIAVASEPGPEPIPALISGSEAELLQRSFQRWSELSSFRADINLEIRAEGEVITVQVYLEQAEGGRTRMDMKLDMGAPTRMDMEMIIDAPDIYIKTDGEGWYRLSADYYGAMGSEVWPLPGTATDPFANPIWMDEIPWESITIRSLGEEEVDGAPAEHLAIEIDLDALFEELADDLKEQLAEGMMMSEEEVDSAWGMITQAVDIRTLDIWIDSRGYTRKALLDIGIEVPGITDSTVLEMKMEMNISDYGEAIVIELPEEYEEFFAMPALPKI